MQINKIKAKLNSDEYSFLKADKHLGSNIILLTAGGSHAYREALLNEALKKAVISLGKEESKPY